MRGIVAGLHITSRTRRLLIHVVVLSLLALTVRPLLALVTFLSAKDLAILGWVMHGERIFLDVVECRNVIEDLLALLDELVVEVGLLLWLFRTGDLLIVIFARRPRFVV
jgi:hypothetical protein